MKKSQTKSKSRVQLRSPKKTRVSRVGYDESNWVLNTIKKFQTAAGGPSRKKLLQESQKQRSKNESFPPGEDKIRVIVSEFLKKGIIKEVNMYDGKSVNSGLVLVQDISNNKLIPNFLGSEPYNAENILADLWEINKNEYRFEKEDFFKLVILKKQLISLPGKLLINPRGNEQMTNAELSALIPYIDVKLKKLEEIKNDQKTFSKFLKNTKKENKVKRFGSYFEKIEKVASKIIESPHNYYKPISIAKKDKKIKSLYDEIDEYFGFLSN